ncbi:hypothetical protein BGW39_003702 [Mortierella sp. 14UC]|nr:hypothetical protein BGW39_003702 [Mortierella sp. 14UC]
MTAAPNGFRVNSFNIHRLLITCLMVAAKFTSDLFYSNARYAKVGGLSLPELNQLELVFLFTTQFDLNVKEEELQRVGNALLLFKNHREASSNTTTDTPASQISLPAPPPAIAAQVVRTVVVVSNSAHHPNSSNNANAASSDSQHRNVVSSLGTNIDTNTTATANATTTNAAAVATASSLDTVVDFRQQPPRAGRFSIPSPTSPKSGPMSDRGLLQKPIPSLPSSSSSSSSSIVSTASSATSSTVSSTEIASLHSDASAGQTTTVVASGSRSQPPQLLSPPEEKHDGWTEGDEHDVHMATPVPTSSALSSSIPSGPN